jgi:glycosyltransferase involved in cell wall biosynthesis
MPDERPRGGLEAEYYSVLSGASWPLQHCPKGDEAPKMTDKTHQPLVSVVINVYNGAAYIDEALASIASQSLADIEVIVVDDGSSDESLEIARKWEANDPRFHVIAQENQGIYKAKNRGIRACSAPYIALMDADDVATRQRLEIQKAYLDSRPEVVCVGGAFQYIDEEGRLLLRFSPPQRSDEIQQALIDGINVIHQPCVMLRLESLLAAGLYDESFEVAGDYDLWLRMSEGGLLANVSEVVLLYRLRDKAVTARRRVLQSNSMQRALDGAWIRKGQPGSAPEVKEKPKPERQQESEGDKWPKHGWWAFQDGDWRS